LTNSKATEASEGMGYGLLNEEDEALEWDCLITIKDNRNTKLYE